MYLMRIGPSGSERPVVRIDRRPQFCKQPGKAVADLGLALSRQAQIDQPVVARRGLDITMTAGQIAQRASIESRRIQRFERDPGANFARRGPRGSRNLPESPRGVATETPDDDDWMSRSPTKADRKM